MAEKLASYGIKGLWNFSSAEIITSVPVAVENVHMSDYLMTLSYKIKQENH
jgi:redox-sensing transcriptional repressor